MQSKLRAFALAAVLVALTSSLAAAQAWPNRPITMLVPFGAGGSIDIPARRLAAELSAKLGQQVVVENRSGANGNIGAAYVAKAAPSALLLQDGKHDKIVPRNAREDLARAASKPKSAASTMMSTPYKGK